MQIHKEISSPVYAIGLMSGTSLDGVDAALIKTDGEIIEYIGGSLTLHYEPEFQQKLRDVLAGADYKEVERELTERHANAVSTLLKQENLRAKDISIIGFHGQTILHEPNQGITQQIGDAALLAKLTGIDVVYDFRSNDVKHGGQGAPLVPVYHQALMQRQPKPVAVVNIGGVANVTWVGKDKKDILAFDTGPGNALINDWVHAHTGKTYDKNGELAVRGKVDEDAVHAFLKHPYFAQMPPKALDRNSFNFNINASLEDGTATLTAITAATIAAAAKYFPQPAKSWIICGGGRHNPILMRMLQDAIPSSILPIEKLGYDGDSIEAEAFAYLAVRSLRGLPLSYPTTTGISRAATGGVFCPA